MRRDDVLLHEIACLGGAADDFDEDQIERILDHVPVATHNQRGLATLMIGVPEGAALDIDAPPPQLARSLLPLLRGRPTASMLASGAYRSSSAHDIEIRSATPMIVDGEPYPAADGCYRLAAGPALRFVTP